MASYIGYTPLFVSITRLLSIYLTKKGLSKLIKVKGLCTYFAQNCLKARRQKTQRRAFIKNFDLNASSNLNQWSNLNQSSNLNRLFLKLKPIELPHFYFGFASLGGESKIK